MSLTARRLSLAIAMFAVLGIAVSSVSLDHHFRKSKTSYCDFGQSFNCDIVNRSEYSTIAGIPVALIGILGYAALLAFATFYREKAETPLILVLCSVAGLGFALRLDPGRASLRLGWKPWTTLEEGTGAVLRWFRDRSGHQP